MRTRIYLDMDGVRCDFIGGVAEWYGLSNRAALEAHWEPGRYGFGFAVKAALRHPLSAEDIEKTFWQAVKGNARFWAKLKPMPWDDELMELVFRLDPSYRFLTSPTDCGHCLVGKHEWLDARGLPGEPKRMIPTCYKSELAAPDRLLIDEHDKNVDEWVAAGGKAILWPALHNRRHAESADDVAWHTARREIMAALQRDPT